MGILEDLENREIDFPDPSLFRDPYSARYKVADQTWLVTHSTRSFWQGKRHGKASISQSTGDGAKYTYQTLADDSLHSTILDAERWGVMGYGKVGKLASWMRETPYGIEDSSGEIRADWRPTWAVLIVRDVQGVVEGMDLLASTAYNSEGIANAVGEVCKHNQSMIDFRPEDLTEIERDTVKCAVNSQEDSKNKPPHRDESSSTRHVHIVKRKRYHGCTVM